MAENKGYYSKEYVAFTSDEIYFIYRRSRPLSRDLDINCYFDLSSCSHGVKIEVKQIDDNYIWLYNENQYLYVELTYFCNYGLTVV